jgi:acyl dehydratase
MEAVDKNFNDIQLEDSASFERTVTSEDVRAFAEVSGDYNPLHMNEEYALKTEFRGRIVHGMFMGALVSRLIGMELPGKKALILKESLEFKKPTQIDDKLTVLGTVVSKSQATQILEIKIEISKEGELVVSGVVYVKVL